MRIIILSICVFIATVAQAQAKKACSEKLSYNIGKGVYEVIRDSVKGINLHDSASQIAAGIVQGVGLNNFHLSIDVDSTSYKIAHGFTTGAINGIKDEKLFDKPLPVPDDAALVDHYMKVLDRSRETLLGPGLDNDVKHLVETATSDTIIARERKVIRGSIDEILSETTDAELARLVNVVGTASTNQLKVAVDTIVRHVDKDIAQAGKEAENKAMPYIILFAITTVLLFAAGIVAYMLHVRRQKLNRLVSILTYQIHTTKDDAVFNDLKNRVSSQAKKEGLEPLLRDLLKKQGTLGDSTRQQ